MPEGQFLVIESEQVQNRRVEVVDVDGIFNDEMAKLRRPDHERVVQNAARRGIATQNRACCRAPARKVCALRRILSQSRGVRFV